MYEAGSQPTYKEWKRKWAAASWQRGGGFPAYLQGMETGNPGPSAQSERRVPSLPTRNGNNWRAGRSTLSRTVPSLPTRNGNLPTSDKAGEQAEFPAYLQGMETFLFGGMRAKGKGSQPTYKEWKLKKVWRVLNGQPGSQPTYKEWKRAI